jgi:hypothetical protein
MFDWIRYLLWERKQQFSLRWSNLENMCYRRDGELYHVFAIQSDGIVEFWEDLIQPMPQSYLDDPATGFGPTVPCGPLREKICTDIESALLKMGFLPKKTNRKGSAVSD